MLKNICLLFFSLILSQYGSTQSTPQSPGTRSYSFVNTQANHISNLNGLSAFYNKLQQVKRTHKGTVRIVHIGDSHLQAGFLTAVVRDKLQATFGNAGRGLVFPYRLAATNGPDDIVSSSKNRWMHNRISFSEAKGKTGICGYFIGSTALSPSINIAIKSGDSDAFFTRIQLFTNDSRWTLTTNDDTSYIIENNQQDNLSSEPLVLRKRTKGFTLQAMAQENNNTKKLYGVSLENDNPGILYHAIGVNGAKYDSYRKADIFLHQLPALKADLYIISLGTNEAQESGMNESELIAVVTDFIHKLKEAAPEADILITTPADSFLKGKTISSPMRTVHAALSAVASSLHLPFWDLYTLTGGYGSSRKWRAAHLMSRDNIHYTKEAYQLQGSLLYKAIANGYHQYNNQ